MCSRCREGGGKGFDLTAYTRENVLVFMRLEDASDQAGHDLHLDRPDLESVFLNLTGRTLRDS